MKANKGFVLAFLIMMLIFSTGCGQILNEAIGTSANAVNEKADSDETLYEITEADMKTTGETPVAVRLEELPDGYLQIAEPGVYLITGKLTDGKIVIDAHDDEIVHLILNGVELYSEEGPSIYVKKAAKVVITLAEGSENVIGDSVNYSEGNEACIFSNVNLTFNGTGALYVYGYYHDAIRTKDCLKILETNIYIQSKNNGIRANDGVAMENSTVNIQSEGIGIKTDSDKDFVVMKGGECKIIAGENAIVSDHYIMIEGCKTDFYAVKETIRCNGEKHINETES